MKIIHIVLFSLCLSLSSHAAVFEKRHFGAAVGAQASSLLYKRGIITYKGYQVFPIYSVQLFNPNLLIAGSAIYLKTQLGDENFFLRTRVNFGATPDRPLYETDEDEDERVERDQTNELDIYLEKHFENGSFARGQISKDLKAHNGYYYEMFARVSLVNMNKASDPALINIGLFASAGYGDEKHNEYLYGAGADKASLNNFEYGLSITSPKVIDSFWPTLKISTFQILGDNKEGSFVRETTGTSIEALFAFKVW